MPRDPRFDILFEPIRIGPVTAPNRFYQVPHCTGMGYRRPQTLAGMRGVKAEGGWGTVNTEYCSIHPSSDDEPYPTTALWDDDDVRAMSLTVDAIHEHGALAGVEFICGDFTDAQVLRQLLELLGGSYVDLVISDMAPNMSGMKAVDQPRAMHLAELAHEFARTVLQPGGSLLTKVFQGEGFESYLRDLRADFERVSSRKPDASRSRSREMYLLARGFKAES